MNHPVRSYPRSSEQALYDRSAADPSPAEAEFTCPITCEIMRDPVVAADGVTYERREITRWIEQQRQLGVVAASPMTNAPLASSILTPNLLVRRLIALHHASPPAPSAPPWPAAWAEADHQRPMPSARPVPAAVAPVPRPRHPALAPTPATPLPARAAERVGAAPDPALAAAVPAAILAERPVLGPADPAHVLAAYTRPCARLVQLVHAALDGGLDASAEEWAAAAQAVAAAERSTTLGASVRVALVRLAPKRSAAARRQLACHLLDAWIAGARGYGFSPAPPRSGADTDLVSATRAGRTYAQLRVLNPTARYQPPAEEAIATLLAELEAALGDHCKSLNRLRRLAASYAESA